MDYQDFIKPELLILVPVLYFIGAVIKKSKLADKCIPYILGAISIFLCLLWIISTSPLCTLQEWATAIYTAVTQGVLIAGASVYVNQLIKQKRKDE